MEQHVVGPWLRGVERAAVVVAHCDDMEIGCGGTIARLVAAGAAVHVVVSTDSGVWRDGAAQVRIEQQQAACERLGVTWHCDYLPECRTDLASGYVAKLDDWLRKWKPQILIAHSSNDWHQDHRWLAEAAARAAWKTVPVVMALETVSARHHSPAVYVDIDGGAYDRKMAALEDHQREGDRWQLGVVGLREAVAAMAAYRGAQCGCERAEAFELLWARV